MSLSRFFQSFKYAKRGLFYAFRHEQNFRIQLYLGTIVLIMAFLFNLRVWEFIVLILLIVMVLVAELLNTAVEYISDLLKPRLNHYVLIIKDIMAGTVLINSIGALIIGGLIFLPHFIGLLK